MFYLHGCCLNLTFDNVLGLFQVFHIHTTQTSSGLASHIFSTLIASCSHFWCTHFLEAPTSYTTPLSHNFTLLAAPLILHCSRAINSHFGVAIPIISASASHHSIHTLLTPFVSSVPFFRARIFKHLQSLRDCLKRPHRWFVRFLVVVAFL